MEQRNFTPVEIILTSYTACGRYRRGCLTVKTPSGFLPVESATEEGEPPGTGNYQNQKDRAVGASRELKIPLVEINYDLIRQVRETIK